MLETFPWFQGQDLDRIVEDLFRIPNNRRVIVEGYGYCRISWSLFFRIRNMLSGFSRRPHSATLRSSGGWGFLARTSGPVRALQNFLGRDRMFTDRLKAEIEGLELRAIEVNSIMTEHDSANLLTKMFGLTLR